MKKSRIKNGLKLVAGMLLLISQIQVLKLMRTLFDPDDEEEETESND